VRDPKASGQRLKESGWIFETEEVSAGVYRVRGTDRLGRSIEATGTDPDALLEKCKSDAVRPLSSDDSEQESGA
jgi:hypothetical protein